MTPVWINGQKQNQLELPHRGLAYGDGLFETLRVQNHQIPLLSRHLERLSSSARMLSIDLDLDNLKSLLSQVLKAPAQRQGVLKIVLLRQHQGRGYGYLHSASDLVIEFYPAESLPLGWELPAVHLGHCLSAVSVNRQLAGHKHLNRLDSVVAAAEVTRAGWDDGLRFIDDRLVEAVSANVFVIRNNRLLTPDLSQAGVQGVARGLVLDLAQQLFTEVQVGPVTLQTLQQADSVFLTNAVSLLRPVASFVSGDTKTAYDSQSAGIKQLTQLLHKEIQR